MQAFAGAHTTHLTDFEKVAVLETWDMRRIESVLFCCGGNNAVTS